MQWDYIYEPEAKELIRWSCSQSIHRVTKSIQAVVENKACEQAARMMAMKNATENAGDLN
jgi:F-type H+-transporting ATPase subunit gamma